jgi:aryl-alcohol dehydrogenase-like predicted oxidoreductase
MEYTQFGQTELTVSKIAFGTWAFGGDWGDSEVETSKQAIRKALELGITFFDTAQAYGFGAAEDVQGEALKPEIRSGREKIIIATKGGLRMQGKTLLHDASRVWLRQGVEESLRHLGTDYIDLYQVHWPDPHTPFEETASALDELVREGKIRYVGVSNYGVWQMQAFAKGGRLDALQPPYHLFRREIEKEILPYTQQHGIGVLVYGPLAHGLLTGKLTPDWHFRANDWRSKSAVFQGIAYRKNLEIVSKLQAWAAQSGRNVAELAIAWTLAHPAVHVAIVGARNPQQIEQTVPAATWHLTSGELEEINIIMRGAVPVGGPTPEGM